MSTNNRSPGFRVWGLDDVVYGPVELQVLVGWVTEGRVTARSWIFLEPAGTWKPAAEVPELQAVFSMLTRPKGRDEDTATIFSPLIPGIRPFSLRRVKVLAAMTDAQLGRFAQLMEVQSARPWEVVVKQGTCGDAMFLILEGDRENQLSTLAAGDFFGETCLFDQGTRSADVVANQDCVFLKITAERFNKLVAEQADLAAPFLFGVSRTLAARIRADNKRINDFLARQLALGD
jgi:hypothetical protein